MKIRYEREVREARQEILNAVSHELNTPLTPVLIHLRRLQERTETLDAETQKSHDVIARNVERLLQRVQDTIRVAQMDSDRFPVNLRTIPLEPQVRQAVQDYQVPADTAGLHLEYQGSSEANVHADAQRLAEVLNHLLDNAIKFTPSGKITVATEDDGTFARVQVTDTGVGFDTAEKDRLFKPFAHLTNDLPHAYHGAGLGLFISQGIIDLHGGQITGHSPGVGQGATFVVQIHVSKGKSFLPGSAEDASKREVAFNTRIRDMV